MMRWDEFQHVAPKLGITTFPEEPEKYEYGFGVGSEGGGYKFSAYGSWDSDSDRWNGILYARPLPAPVVHPLFGELPEGCDTVARRSQVLEYEFGAPYVWETDTERFVTDYPPYQNGDIIAYNSKEINKPC